MYLDQESQERRNDARGEGQPSANVGATGDRAIVLGAGCAPFSEGCSDQDCRITGSRTGTVSHANGARGVGVLRQPSDVFQPEVSGLRRSRSWRGEGADLSPVLQFEFHRPTCIDVHDAGERNDHRREHVRHLDGGIGDRHTGQPVRPDRDDASQSSEAEGWGSRSEALRKGVGRRGTECDNHDHDRGDSRGARPERRGLSWGRASHRTIVARREVRA
jgi:hypothetical protein